ncbi:hypothetical protein JYU20_02515 [Bacteroidales bacterium AH-315-I05]|nr:hypothetical protein [Bacteroidales bacterium AH-315-I05]
MKTILTISLWVLAIGGLFIVLGFVDASKKEIRCKGLKVNIDYSEGHYFVLEEDIKELFRNQGYKTGQYLCDIDIPNIERMLNNSSSVKNADVFATIDGQLNANITQRKPIVRIFSKNGDDYYLDEQGRLMPLSHKYTARVPVANGYIFEPFIGNHKQGVENLKGSVLMDIYLLANFLRQSEFWKAQINQIYIAENQDIELIPRVGNHTIVLGSVENVEEKFEKLMIFYEKGLSKTGWNEYSVINLKYKNQIVCKKR